MTTNELIEELKRKGLGEELVKAWGGLSPSQGGKDEIDLSDYFTLDWLKSVIESDSQKKDIAERLVKGSKKKKHSNKILSEKDFGLGLEEKWNRMNKKDRCEILKDAVKVSPNIRVSLASGEWSNLPDSIKKNLKRVSKVTISMREIVGNNGELKAGDLVGVRGGKDLGKGVIREFNEGSQSFIVDWYDGDTTHEGSQDLVKLSEKKRA
jgi:hypothetical protein